MIIVRNNYIIIICNNDTTAVINSNCGKLKKLTLLFKITMGTLKNFFDIYRQFGHTPSRRVAGIDRVFLHKLSMSSFLQEILVICYLQI